MLKSLNIAGFTTKTHQKARIKTHKSVKPCKYYNAGMPIAAKAAVVSITGMQAA